MYFIKHIIEKESSTLRKQIGESSTNLLIGNTSYTQIDKLPRYHLEDPKEL